MRPIYFGTMPGRPRARPPKPHEKQVLMGLACTWAQAALMSERVLGSSFIPSPRNPHDGASVAGTSARLAPRDPYHVFRLFYERYLPEVPQTNKARCYRATFNSPRPCGPQVRMRGLRGCEDQNPVPEAGSCRLNWQPRGSEGPPW